MNIPQDIKDKIANEGFTYTSDLCGGEGEDWGNINENKFHGKDIFRAFTEAASFGYKLAQEEITRLNEVLALKEQQRKEWADMCVRKQGEVERIKQLIRKMFEGESYPDNWLQFATDNNLK